MVPEPSPVAFRAQLVIAEQRQLYDYWLTCGGGAAMPARRDIHPADIPRLLPNISLIDIEPPPRRFRFRLAGTGIREIYGREVTGLYLDELEWGGQAPYWQAAHDWVTDSGRPAQGVVRSPRVVKDHLVQFWLRLPLATDGTVPGMILCYDVPVPVSDMAGSIRGASGLSAAATG